MLATVYVCPECGETIEACNARAIREMDRRAGRRHGPIATPQARIEHILRSVAGLGICVSETSERILAALRDD